MPPKSHVELYDCPDCGNAVWRYKFYHPGHLFMHIDFRERDVCPGYLKRKERGSKKVEIAVLDIDGVISDISHRIRHILQKPKDWESFYAAISEDSLLQTGKDLAISLAENNRIIYLTGRRESKRAETIAWLQKYGLPSGELLMRADKDHRPSSVIKPEHLRDHPIFQVGQITLIVEDDPEVCAAYRGLGYNVLQAMWGRIPEMWDSSAIYEDPDYKK